MKIGDQACVESQWYELGEAIGIPRDYLDNLSGEESQCLKNVLDYWLRHHPGLPVWQEVAEALRKLHLQFELEGI